MRPLKTQPATTQTESGKSIFTNIVQLMKIKRLKMWGFVSRPVLKRRVQAGAFFFFLFSLSSFILYLRYTNTNMPDCPGYVISLYGDFPSDIFFFSYISWKSPSRYILLNTPPLTIHIFGSPITIVFTQYMSHIQYVFRGYKFRKCEFNAVLRIRIRDPE